MKLLERFRAQPEWQSDDPLVRAAAVRDLPDEEETRDVLLDIASNDTHPDVRCQAVSRINDIDALVSIYRSDDAEAVRHEAAAGIRDLAIDSPEGEVGIRGVEALSEERDLVAVAREARIETVGRMALARLQSPRALSVVARRAIRPEVAKEALQRLDDPEELQAVAVKSEDKAIALGAFERLVATGVATEVIEQIGRRARQKAVQRRAKTALSSPDDKEEQKTDAPAAPDQTAHLACCVEVEKVLQTEEGDLARGRAALETVVRRWSDLESSPDESLASRFASGREAASAHLATLDSAQTARRRAEEQVAHEGRQADGDRIAGVLTELEQLADEMQKLVADEAVSGKPWSGAEQRWRTLSEKLTGGPGGNTLEPAHQSALALLHERAAALEIRRRALLDRTKTEREQSEQENLGRLQQRVKTATGLVSSEKLTLEDAERQLRVLRRLHDSPGLLPRRERDAVLKSLKDVQVGLAGRVRELREFADWQRWANLGIQEQLCARMEALRLMPGFLDSASAEDGPGAKVAPDEKAESVEPSPAEEPAVAAGVPGTDPVVAVDSPAAYSADSVVAVDSPAADSAVAVDPAKDSPIDSLTDPTVAPDSSPVVSETGPAEGPQPDSQLDGEFLAQFEEIMTSWRQSADVPKDRGADLWERFKVATDAVYPRYERCQVAVASAREAHLARQKAIVEEVEKLASSSDWLKTVQRITELQAEWKTLSGSPGKMQRALWRRFRSGCNEFFTRRKADLAARKKEWSANLEFKEALCVRIEALVESEDLPAAIAEAKRAQAEWKTVGPVRRTRADAIWQRFRAACDAIFDRIHAGERAAAAKRAAVREALCVELEALIVQAEDSAESLAAGDAGPGRADTPGAAEAGPAADIASVADAGPASANTASVADAGADSANTPSEADAASDSVDTALADADVPGEPVRVAEIRSDTNDESRGAAAGEAESANATPPAIPTTEEVSAPAVPSSAADDDSVLADKVRDLQTRWRDAPDVPQTVSRQLTARFGTALAKLVELRPEAVSGTDLDPARTLKRLQKLCERIESLEPTTAQAETALSPSEMLASKWRDALASNLMGTRANDDAKKRSAADEVRRARQDVARIGPVSGDTGRALTRRFDDACDFVMRWAGAAGLPATRAGHSSKPKSSRPRRRPERPSGDRTPRPSGKDSSPGKG